MSSPALRIGFAGANARRGWAIDAHLAAIRALHGLEVFAVAARDQDNADAAASAFGATKAYDDALAMVRDPDVDIVAVTVRVPEHQAIALAALGAGKHVYCEWPLGRDIAETKEMAAAARAAGVHAAVGLQGLHAPAVRHAAELVRRGAIGRLLNLRVVSPTAGWAAEAPPHYAYLQDKRNGATLLTITGGHTLAVMEAIAGRVTEFEVIGSILCDRVHISGSDEFVQRTSPDHLLVIGRQKGGCVFSLEVMGGCGDMPFRFELRGTEGTLVITGRHPGGFQLGALEVKTNPPSPAQPLPICPNVAIPSLNVAESWAAFAADIRNDRHTVPDFDTAVSLACLVDAIDGAHNPNKYVNCEE